MKSQTEETLEQKQQRQSRYKDLLIISAPVKDDSDESSSVLCLITLPEEDQLMNPIMPPSKQLTIRISREGKILKFDYSQMQPNIVAFLSKEIGHMFEELVHPHDIQRMKMHIKEVLEGHSDAPMSGYRLMLSPDYYVHTKVQSNFFPSSIPDEPDFVMAVHEIISETDQLALDAPSFSGLQQQPNTSHSTMTSNNSGLGGPLMTSVINGGQLPQMSPHNGLNSLLNNDNNNSLLPPTSSDNFLNPESLYNDLFEMENNWMDSRAESSTSMTSVNSTTRPSSATAAFSPVNVPMCPSPLTPYSQPSPASVTNNNNTTMTNNNLSNSLSNINNESMVFVNVASNNNNNNNNANNFFSFGEKEKAQEQERRKSTSESSNPSEKLRNLLMKNPSNSGAETSDQERARNNPNQILKVS